MSVRTAHIHTPLGRVVRTTGTLVEVFVDPQVTITAQAVREAMQARRALLAEDRGPVLFFAKGSPAWDMDLFHADLFADDRASITAMGVVLDNRVLATAIRMYFGLFPAPYPARFANDEAAIRAWIADHGT